VRRRLKKKHSGKSGASKSKEHLSNEMVYIRVKEKLRFIIIYNKIAKVYLKCKHFQKVGDVNKACRQWNVTC
jgi:hypothetical protein